MGKESATSPGTFLEKGTAYIKNPLGIIGLFIALIYAMAALVAGFSQSLTEAQRWLMVGFSVSFPGAVLGVFYRLVTKYPKNLYAPGDWKDERHFFGPQSNELVEQREEAEAELLAPPKEATEQRPSLPKQPVHRQLPAGAPQGLAPHDLRILAREGEDLAFKWLEKEFPDETIYRHMRIDGPNPGVAFDGIVTRPTRRQAIAIEVKVVRSISVISKLVTELSRTIGLAIANFASVPDPGSLDFIVVIVTVGLEDAARHEVARLARQLFIQSKRHVDLRVVDIEQLRQDASQSL